MGETPRSMGRVMMGFLCQSMAGKKTLWQRHLGALAQWPKTLYAAFASSALMGTFATAAALPCLAWFAIVIAGSTSSSRHFVATTAHRVVIANGRPIIAPLPHRVIAGSEATRQSMQRLSFSKCRSRLQDCNWIATRPAGTRNDAYPSLPHRQGSNAPSPQPSP
jgi:hypothetical protein